MHFHSKRNVEVSAGDAAVLIRALNRQRTDDAAKATRPGDSAKAAQNLSGVNHLRVVGRKTAPEVGVSASTRRPLPSSRRKSSERDMAAGAGSSILFDGRGRSSSRGTVAAAGIGVPSSGRRKPDSAVRAVEREQVEKGDRRARRSRVGDEGPEAHSGRSTRATGSRSHSSAENRTSKKDGNPLTAVAAWFTDLTPRTQKGLAVAACAIALVGFFYGPTADLYAAARDHSQLVAKVEATNAVADDLKAEVDRLQTEEGVMDEARIRGYARPDEVAGDASELLGIEDTVKVPELSKPIETEEPPLYIKALDVILGYEEHV